MNATAKPPAIPVVNIRSESTMAVPSVAAAALVIARLVRDVVRGDQRVAAVDDGNTASVVDAPREPELFLELVDEAPRLVAVEHVPVAFDSAVAKREVDEAARKAALGHAVVSVLGDVHCCALFRGFDGGIAARGGRKT